MIPHPPRQRMEIFSLRSTIITITTTIITASIAGITSPASSWFLPDIAATITTITITTITASIAATIEVVLRTVRKRACGPCFFVWPELGLAGFFLGGAMQMPVGAVEYGIR